MAEDKKSYAQEVLDNLKKKKDPSIVVSKTFNVDWIEWLGKMWKKLFKKEGI